MIGARFDPSHRGQRRDDRGPRILHCDGCGKRATPSKAERDSWQSVLGRVGESPAVVDVCPSCVAMLRA